MNKHALLPILVTTMLALFLLLGTAPLSAQTFNDYSPRGHLIGSASQALFAKPTAEILSAPMHSGSLSVLTDVDSQSSVLEELGYVLAMETVFTGMSFLGSRQNGWGPAITGGFDLFLGVAGLENASLKESGAQKTGHYLISAGFAAKALYNFHFGKGHSKKAQWWTNIIGYNVLVFAGYFLDTLE